MPIPQPFSQAVPEDHSETAMPASVAANFPLAATHSPTDSSEPQSVTTSRVTEALPVAPGIPMPSTVKAPGQLLQRRSSGTATSNPLPLARPIVQQAMPTPAIARQLQSASAVNPPSLNSTAPLTVQRAVAPLETAAPNQRSNLPSIAELTDQVGRRLSRQVEIERDRRGDFEWRS